MIKHYFRIAWRNLWKNKVFSAINIIGLTTGLSCCLLMVLYLQHELSYDKFQAKGDRIVRLIMETSQNGSVNKGNYTSTKVMPAFVRNFPEVETGVRMAKYNRVVKYGDKLFSEKNFMYADSTFFRMFSFKLVTGNSGQVLERRNQVVITQSTAKKYFGNADPIGKIMIVGSSNAAYEITGITEDCPSNSQIKFDFLASFSTLGVSQEETYWNANFTTYLLLKDKADIASLQSKIPVFMKKEMHSEVTDNDYLTYELEPFKKIHLYSEYEGFEPNNSITYIYIVVAITLLILLIACFTYINLSTARSVDRAKEVGIRKVTGAVRGQIFWQFISESVILTAFALAFSIGMAYSVLPAFNHLADTHLSPRSLFTISIAGFSLLFVFCISLLAGSYPALVLSGFQPVKVLKGTFKTSGSGLWLRKSLIVFQFAITVFLITSTFIIQRQLYFIQHKNVGYNREHVLVLPLDQKMMDILTTIKTEYKTNPNVISLSRTVNDPTFIEGGYSMRRADMPAEAYDAVTANPVDEDFIKTTGLQMITGTDFTLQDIQDVSYEEQEKKNYQFILNESAVKKLGWKPEEAIGKKMFLGDQRPGFVKAVVKDFHFASLHEPIQPLVLFTDTWGNNLLIKLSGTNLPQTISFLEKKWKTLVPHRPFEYTFLDENYDKLYHAELRTGKVLNIFAGIAIVLACLGLFGLSAYTIQQRTKEIGVRKILGASVSGIVVLLSNQFIRLVGIAFIIAAPLAWLALHKWLQDFAYRIQISWIVFAVSALLTMLLAMIAVSFQAIRAAIANPVKSLRSE